MHIAARMINPPQPKHPQSQSRRPRRPLLRGPPPDPPEAAEAEPVGVQARLIAMRLSMVVAEPVAESSAPVRAGHVRLVPPDRVLQKVPVLR